MVAIEFAASCIPLMKSNASATPTIRMTPTRPRSTESLLPVLEDDAFHDVGHVFGAVGGGFQLVVDFAPLDAAAHILLVLEEVAHRRAEKAVALVLQPVDLNRERQHRFELRPPQVRHRLLQS